MRDIIWLASRAVFCFLSFFMTTIFIYTAIFSAIGLIVLTGRAVADVRKINKEEFRARFIEMKPFFHDLNVRAVFPMRMYLSVIILPKIYKEFEIVISKFRINVLRIERMLLHLAHYMRGKREVKINGGSHPYWDNLGSPKDEKKPDQN